MRNKQIILKILAKDIEKKHELFDNELKHIIKVAEFLGKQKLNGTNNDFDKNNSIYLSSAFKNLFPILLSLNSNIDSLKEKIKNFNFNNNNNDFDNNNNKNENNIELAYFFKNLTEIRSELDLITDKFNFLQRKIINIINSFPFYYPTPKVSSYREASKIHFFLEWVSSEFLDFLLKETKANNEEKNKVVYSNFYWNFEKEISFIPDIEYKKGNYELINFVISSDFYLPYRRSHYILIFHECLHFYFKFLDKEFKKNLFEYKKKDKEKIEKDFPKEFISLRKYILGAKSILNELEVGAFLDFDDILDIFIDSILTKVFDKYYYLPLFSHIFLYDEGLFINPNLQRKWYVRTKLPLNFLKNEIDEMINEILEDYKKEQIKTFKAIESAYIEDERIILVLKKYIETYIQKNKNFTKNLQENLKNKEWINILLEYQKEYIDDILENFYEKEKKKFYEGRTLAIKLHNKLLDANITYKNTDQIKIYSFKYIKMRANESYGKFLEEFLSKNNSPQSNNSKHKKYLFNYGSYSFLKIEREEEKQKNKNQQNKEEAEDATLNYSNNYELTLFNEEVEKFEEFLKTLDEKIILNIKLLVDIEKKKDYEDIKNHFEDNLNKINGFDIKPFYFISFDWFDLFVSLIINIENIEDINLTELLAQVKENLIINADFIHRSETEIFLGKEVIQKTKIENPKLQVRLAGGHQSNIDEIDKIFKNINEEVDINYLYGIRDIEVEYKSEINLKNILEEISKAQSNLEQSSDIQFIPSTPKKQSKESNKE